MTEKAIVPTADVILRPALEQFYVLRPQSQQFINYRSGVYWHPFLGFRAQTARMLKRLTDLVSANRLKTATGQTLKDYVASEYDAVPDTSKTFAIGEIVLTRTTSAIAGDVRKGTKFARKANPTTQMPVTAAEYELLVDVHFDVGQTVTAAVPIQATVAGAAANHPIRTDTVDPGVRPVGNQLFDTTITVASFNAAGGAETADDDYVRRFAKAFAVGQYGPTQAASRLGALSATGVRNLLVYDIPGTGTQQILVADESWCSSARWAAGIRQSLYDSDLVGFGCKVVTAPVRNVVVSVEATVVVRDINYTRETTEIDLAIRAAVEDYLDNRDDWNVWKVNQLKGVIARAHPKIFNCTSVVMKDTTGAIVSEITSPDYTQEQFHYQLSSGAVKTTYQGPS